MNIKYNFKEILSFSFAITFMAQSLQAISIDGEEVDFGNQSRLSIKCKIEDASNIIFDVNDDNIETGSLDSPDIVTEWNGYYEEAKQNYVKYKGSTLKAGTDIFSSSKKGLTTEVSYMNAGKTIRLSDESSIKIYQTISEAKEEITLTSPRILLDSFFASTPRKVLFLAPEDSTSWLEGISFSSAPSPKRLYSLGFDGLLNFNNLSETNGDNAFLAVGTDTVTLHLKNLEQ